MFKLQQVDFFADSIIVVVAGEQRQRVVHGSCTDKSIDSLQIGYGRNIEWFLLVDCGVNYHSFMARKLLGQPPIE
ncbi:MAG: hypothetical protein L3J57_08065 [Desulfuromusa sp.]|nr:hypothetical protein [Desulfuromusa sp.]